MKHGDGGWIRDYVTEMFCDMALPPEDLLEQAWRVQCNMVSDPQPFEEFKRIYRVITDA